MITTLPTKYESLQVTQQKFSFWSFLLKDSSVGLTLLAMLNHKTPTRKPDIKRYRQCWASSSSRRDARSDEIQTRPRGHHPADDCNRQDERRTNARPECI